MPEEVFRISRDLKGFVEFEHIQEGHRFTFHLATTEDDERVVSPDYRLNANPRASHLGRHFESEAFVFAKSHFKRTGQLD